MQYLILLKELDPDGYIVVDEPILILSEVFLTSPNISQRPGMTSRASRRQGLGRNREKDRGENQARVEEVGGKITRRCLSVNSNLYHGVYSGENDKYSEHCY